jgi:hypothetical protein
MRDSDWNLATLETGITKVRRLSYLLVKDCAISVTYLCVRTRIFDWIRLMISRVHSCEAVTPTHPLSHSLSFTLCLPRVHSSTLTLNVALYLHPVPPPLPNSSPSSPVLLPRPPPNLTTQSSSPAPLPRAQATLRSQTWCPAAAPPLRCTRSTC